VPSFATTSSTEAWGGTARPANDANQSRGGATGPQIEEGAMVRERQKIFSLPDIAHMRVNTKVHESMVDRVSKGLPARIKVDALPAIPLTGTVKNASGATVGNVTQTVSTPAAVTAVSCSILNLILGPLHLNVLGLVVDLNQVILVITAVPGAGALLGNLLCAVAGLLDGTPSLGALTILLNSILALLGAL